MSFLAKRLLMATSKRSYRETVLADDPYAYWPLNETYAQDTTVVLDLSGNGRHGKYPGMATMQGASPLLPASRDNYLLFLNSGAAVYWADLSAGAGFCAGSAWPAECWAIITSYNSPGPIHHLWRHLPDRRKRDESRL